MTRCRPLVPVLAAALALAGAFALAGCDRRGLVADPVVAEYTDWRRPGTRAEVTMRQLAGWRQLPGRRGAARPAPEEEIAALLRTLWLAEEMPESLPAPVARQVRDAEDRVLELALRERVRGDASARDAEDSAPVRSAPRPLLLRLRNLLVRVEPGASEAERQAARERADALHAELAAGAEFGALAERASDSETRARAGRLGWVNPDRLPPELREAALALAPGEHSAVLASNEGWVILACDGVREAESNAAHEARIAAAAQSRIEREAWSALRKELLAEADTDPSLQDLPPAARIRAAAAQRARARGLDDAPATAELLRWSRARVLSDARLRELAEARAEPVTEPEVRADYDAQTTRWQTKPTTRVRAILIAPDPPGELPSPTARERAEALRAALDAGERLFAFAARELSAHPSRPGGGDLGWLTDAELAALGPGLARAIAALGDGETSPVVAQSEGFWIAEVLARRPGREVPLEEVAEILEHRLAEQRVREASSAILRERTAALEIALRQEPAAPVSQPAAPEASDAR